MGDYPEMKTTVWVCIALLAAVLMLHTCSARADNRLAISSALILADTLTTYQGLKQDNVRERNPLLGDHPSTGKQALFAALKLSVNWAVLTHADKPTRNAWFWGVCIIEGAATTNNLIVLHRNW